MGTVIETLKRRLTALEAVTVERGATPAEADTAALMAAKIRAQLTKQEPPKTTYSGPGLLIELMSCDWFLRWQIVGYEGDSDKLERLDNVSHARRIVAQLAFASGARVQRYARYWQADHVETRLNLQEAILDRPRAAWREVLEVTHDPV